MFTLDVSTLRHSGRFGITSIGFLYVGYAGSSNASSDTRDERDDTLPALGVHIGTCSFTGVLECFRVVE